MRNINILIEVLVLSSRPQEMRRLLCWSWGWSWTLSIVTRVCWLGEGKTDQDVVFPPSPGCWYVVQFWNVMYGGGSNSTMPMSHSQ